MAIYTLEELKTAEDTAAEQLAVIEKELEAANDKVTAAEESLKSAIASGKPEKVTATMAALKKAKAEHTDMEGIVDMARKAAANVCSNDELMESSKAATEPFLKPIEEARKEYEAARKKMAAAYIRLGKAVNAACKVQESYERYWLRNPRNRNTVGRFRNNIIPKTIPYVYDTKFLTGLIDGNDLFLLQGAIDEFRYNPRIDEVKVNV